MHTHRILVLALINIPNVLANSAACADCVQSHFDGWICDLSVRSLAVWRTRQECWVGVFGEEDRIVVQANLDGLKFFEFCGRKVSLELL